MSSGSSATITASSSNNDSVLPVAENPSSDSGHVSNNFDQDDIVTVLGDIQLGESDLPSTSRTSSVNQPVKGLAPIAKQDLPYKQQKFFPRPSEQIDRSGLAKTLQIETNYFRLNFPNEVEVLQYDIQYRNRNNLEMRKAEFTGKAFWYAYRHVFDEEIFPDRHLFAYNGVNILWSLKHLNFPEGEHHIEFQTNDGKKYTMIVKYVKKFLLKPNSTDIINQMNLTSVLDDVLTSRLTCLYETTAVEFHKEGRSMFYNPPDLDLRNHVISLGGGFEAWTGLHGAVKPNLQAGLLLNVDIGHSIFSKQRCNLIHYYVEVITNMPFDKRNLHILEKRGMNRDARKKLDDVLKGKTLEYRVPIPDGQNRLFKYSMVADRSATVHYFKARNGDETSIDKYYLDQYKYQLQYPHLPCICINKAKKLFVPMELVYTDFMAYKMKGKIPEKQLRTLVQKTAYSPLERRNILLTMAAVTDSNKPLYLAEQDEYMASFGVSVDRQLLTVPASLLPAPTLEFGGGVKVVDNTTGSWSLNEGKSMKKICSEQLSIIPCLIYMTPQSDKNKYTPDVRPLGTLMEVLYNFGMEVPGGRDAFVVDSFDFCKRQWGELVDWMRSFKSNVHIKFPGKNVRPLAIFVFPYKCTTRRQKCDQYEYFSEYSMVKYICDVRVGLHSQCIQDLTYRNMEGNALSNSTAHNVAIKVLGKLGATLYTIPQNSDPQTEQEKCWSKMINPEEPVLILGIDVTHPGVQDRKEGRYSALSVASVIGNVDSNLMQYEASVRVQARGEERTLYIKDEVGRRIVEFEKNCNKKPSHLVVYRDGISESQFQEILYEEKKNIQDAIKEIDCSYNPTLSYIVVSKRHHTRFFPTQPQDCWGKVNNLKPGTLVESDITTKNFYDFFLISHRGELGTSRPTHYYVLHDEWAPTPTFWQYVTNNLTYGFIRCPKAISQPAPVMYAHLAAKRAKDYLMAHVNVHRNDLDKMSEYEAQVNLRRHMEKAKDLNGMVFV